jgi:hypothetical protein
MKIKIKVEALPLHFLILGGFFILYAIYNLLIWQAVILNSVLLIIGILMLTSHQSLLINTENKAYSEYYWVLGIKINNYSEQYEEITSLECSESNYSQQYGKYNRRFISGTMYKGYIELKDQEKLFVGQNKSKGAMLKRLTKISGQLKVNVVDRTNEE